MVPLYISYDMMIGLQNMVELQKNMVSLQYVVDIYSYRNFAIYRLPWRNLSEKVRPPYITYLNKEGNCSINRARNPRWVMASRLVSDPCEESQPKSFQPHFKNYYCFIKLAIN